METKDILLYESGNGGDIAILNNDIALGDQLYQQAYLCLFGGNIEAITRGDELDGHIRNDWWGNSLLFANNKAKQFNSLTEKALRSNALTSVGRINIIRAIETDLKYLKNVANILVDAIILGTNRIKIAIELTRPDNSQPVAISIIWDNAKQELIIDKSI